MKKLIPLAIMGILVLSGLAASALPTDQQTEQGNQGSRVYTHTIFAEDGTATWCPHCPYAHGSLWRIYMLGKKPMYYTALVSDVNTHAYARALELGLTGYPTVWFDGGYRKVVGSVNDNYQQTMAAYNTSLDACGARAVPDIWVTLNVTWLGSATMDIRCSVQNNQTATDYSGKIRVFITEVQSSMGWLDTLNHKYTFPFLEYAFNQSINISAGGTWSGEKTWDGHNYNDGYGHTFGSIQYGNIMVLAAIYNSTAHGILHYADDCTGFWVGSNTPPNVPSGPNPASGATSVDINKDVSWTGGDPDPSHDTVTYDVYFGTTSTPSKVASNQSASSYDPGTLAYLTKYYWQIVAWDNHGATTAGPVWYFTTSEEPNNPPSAPTITGPSSGKPNTNYTFTFVATDPDEDQVQYLINWGDGTNSGWTTMHASGAQVQLGHTWTVKGTFSITAKAKDEHSAEGPTSTLSVQMPLSTPYGFTPFLEWLFAQFPHAFPVLRHLLGY